MNASTKTLLGKVTRSSKLVWNRKNIYRRSVLSRPKERLLGPKTHLWNEKHPPKELIVSTPSGPNETQNLTRFARCAQIPPSPNKTKPELPWRSNWVLPSTRYRTPKYCTRTLPPKRSACGNSSRKSSSRMALASRLLLPLRNPLYPKSNSRLSRIAIGLRRGRD